MKAVRIHQYGDVDQLVIEDTPDPQPGAGEILVGQVASSVNPVDWKVLSGAYQHFMPLAMPGILGRDVAGTVKQLGAGVTRFKIGDPVIAVGRETWAELVVGKADAFARVPEGLDLTEAAALPLVTLTGVQLIEEGVGIKQGQRILITGALGSVGRSAVYAAQRAGAEVTAGVRAREFEAAAELKADALLALDQESTYGQAGRFDAIADTIGPEISAKLLGLVKAGGMLVTVTEPPSNAAQFPQVKVSGFQSHADGRRLSEIAEDVLNRKLNIPIASRFPLTKARDAVATARKGAGGKVLLLI
ncbi:MAG: NADP-dependent oxidoreductase [Acidobacteriaceae bacterium]